MGLFDLPKERNEGDRLRDEGIALVTSHNLAWIDRATIILKLVIESMTPGTLFMSSDINKRVEIKVGPPNHCNAWGALTRRALMRGYIEETGDFRKSASAKNHSHRYPVYKVR